MKRISGCLLVQPPWTSRANYSWFLRVVSRWLLNISMGRNPTTSLYNLCQCLVTLKVNTDTNRTSVCLGLCSFPLVLPLGTTEESLALSALHPPLRYLYTLIRFSRLSGPISPSLSSEERCSGLFITFVTLCWTSSTVCPCLSCTGEPMDWTQHSRNPSALLSSREASPPLTCWPGSASCRPGGSCSYLPQCHIIREKASYYGINTDTHLFLELNRRYLKLKVIQKF